LFMSTTGIDFCWFEKNVAFKKENCLRIRLTVSRMVMECFVKALYVVLVGYIRIFDLQSMKFDFYFCLTRFQYSVDFLCRQRERDGGKFKMLFADVFVEYDTST
ncbi:hypothetical protein T05_680, partial [Trichinella murrelli]